MDSGVLMATSRGDSLPLASLRLLVSPLQLMTASMWQVLKKQDVMNYWKVAEFVSLVVDMVPELLMCKHRTQLNLGLRVRYILELCRNEDLVKPEFIMPYLDKVKSPHATLVDIEASKEEDVIVTFLELIQTLLKDPEERQDFFTSLDLSMTVICRRCFGSSTVDWLNCCLFLTLSRLCPGSELNPLHWRIVFMQSVNLQI